MFYIKNVIISCMLDQKTTNIIKQIIRRHLPDTSYKSFIFGSRATGTNRQFSDIDLGILGPKSLSPQEYISIKDDLDQSDIVYRVDLVDFTNVSDNFKQIALNNIIKIWTKK